MIKFLLDVWFMRELFVESVVKEPKIRKKVYTREEIEEVLRHLWV